MKHFNITSKVRIRVSDAFTATEDKNADFNQIVLRVRNGDKFVNFRVERLGEVITIEFFRCGCYAQASLTLINHSLHNLAFQSVMDQFLA